MSCMSRIQNSTLTFLVIVREHLLRKDGENNNEGNKEANCVRAIIITVPITLFIS